jgi:hypothetical protein
VMVYGSEQLEWEGGSTATTGPRGPNDMTKQHRRHILYAHKEAFQHGRERWQRRRIELLDVLSCIASHSCRSSYSEHEAKVN